MRIALFLLLFLAVVVTAATAPFVLEEPNTISRTGDAAIAGVPFAKGEVTSLSQLALIGPSGEVAAQFNGLSKYEDGSYKWVLTSFISDIAKNGTQSYSVKTQAPTATPASPVTISRNGNVVTISNGLVRLKIDTVNFTGFDSLYYKGTEIAGGKSGGIFLNSFSDGMLYANGPVTKAGVVYAGPMRVTYRVQGNFVKGSCGGVGYSFMVTLFAGSDRMRLDVSVRNSINETCGNYHKVRRCYVKLPLLFSPTTETSFLNKPDTTGYGKPEMLCLSTSSLGLSVHENWGGGYYSGAANLGANSRPTGYYQYHNIERSGSDLYIDVIVEQDSTKPHNSWTRGYEDTGFFWMIDGTHKNSDIFFSFSNGGKSSTELNNDYLLNRNILMGRPDPAYVSTLGAYGVLNKFGTLEDEKATWQKFGCDTAGGVTQVMSRYHDMQVYSVGSSVHTDMEEDPGEQYLFMWLRTGQRGYLDYAEAWARYEMTNWTIHTDGWEFDGCDHIDQAIRLKATRTLTKPTGTWNGATIQNNYTHDGSTGSGWVGCHMGGQGAIDYYCLTGDPEALDAATDLGEYAWVQSWSHSSMTSPVKPLLPFTLSDSVPAPSVKNVGREATRPFKYLVSFVNQIKRDNPLWRDRMTYAAKSWLRAINRDPRGFVFSGSGYLSGWQASSILDTLKFPKLLKDFMAANKISMREFDARTNPLIGDFEGRPNPWRFQIAVEKINGPGDTLRWFPRSDNTYWTYRMPQPMDLYYQITGDEDARDFVMAYGQFLSLSNLALDSCGFGGYASYDFPLPNMSVSGTYSKWNPDTHSVCWGPNRFSTAKGVLPLHNSAYGVYYPSVMALGYKHTGDKRILDKAFEIWNLNVKRDYKTTTTLSYYPVAEKIAKYGYLNLNYYNTVGDRYTGGLSLFYEAVHHGNDTIAPEAATNVWASHDENTVGKVLFSFTAPADRGGGTVAEYQVKYDTVPIVDYDQFNFANDYIFPAKGLKKSPWWYAKNVIGEAAVQPAGNSVFSILNTGMNRNKTWYIAVRSRDLTGNLSPMSTVFRLTPDMISVEKDALAEKAFNVSVSPNPANPAVMLSYTLPVASAVSIKIFDASGRMVRELIEKAVKQSGRIIWNGKDSNGKPVSTGLYYAKIKAGALSKQLRLVIMK